MIQYVVYITPNSITVWAPFLLILSLSKNSRIRCKGFWVLGLSFLGLLDELYKMAKTVFLFWSLDWLYKRKYRKFTVLRKIEKFRSNFRYFPDTFLMKSRHPSHSAFNSAYNRMLNRCVVLPLWPPIRLQFGYLFWPFLAPFNASRIRYRRFGHLGLRFSGATRRALQLGQYSFFTIFFYEHRSLRSATFN